MIRLFEEDLRQDSRRSSKGNQLKWEHDGVWYKADYTGYEGLSEYMISHLLRYSTLSVNEYALYDPEVISYKAACYNGCKSADISDGWQIITLERLFKQQFGRSLSRDIFSVEGIPDRILFLASEVERVTGIRQFGNYICKLFTIDALFLNEDRHTHNISVLMNNRGNYKLCPIYDNGASLLSDTTMDYPLGIDIYVAINSVQAKTVCFSFIDQLNAAEELYGRGISFNWGEREVSRLLDKAEAYSTDIKDRVFNILMEQRRRYSYLFC